MGREPPELDPFLFDAPGWGLYFGRGACKSAVLKVLKLWACLDRGEVSGGG